MSGSEPTIVKPTVSFIYNDDTSVTWYNRAGTAATIVTGNAFSINFGAFLGGTTSNPEMRTKLLYYFNLYQRFRVTTVTKEWHPRWGAPDMQALAYTTNLAAALETEPEWLEMQAMASFFQNSHYMTFIEDDDDWIQRFTLNEYWQVRSNPRARTWKVCDNNSFSYTPSVFNVTQNPIRLSQAQGDVTNHQQDFQANNISQSASQPMNMPWQATKAYRIDGAIQYGFNMQDNSYLGGKLYFYTPNNYPMPDVAAIQVPIGFFTTRVVFEFQDPDFRALVPYPTFTPALQRVDENGLLIVEDLQNQNTIPRQEEGVEFMGPGLTTEEINRQKVNSMSKDTNARAERAANRKKLKQQEVAMA